MELMNRLETAIVAAGCFWGVEDVFSRYPGVVATCVGYSGGTTPDPTYDAVCTGNTGHAETVKIIFDPAVTSYENMVHCLFGLHDPTQYHRQGPDIGSQYRSIIFYQNSRQKHIAQRIKHALDASKKFSAPIVTEIIPAAVFYPAEEYHQHYHAKHHLPACHQLRA